MLTPEYLSKCPEYFIQLYQELEDFILKDVPAGLLRQGKSRTLRNGKCSA